MAALAVTWGGVAAAQTPHTWPAAPAGVQVTREGLFEFSTVDVVGLSAYQGVPGNPTLPTAPIGRGAVDHAFRISRTEMTVREFVPFLNVISMNTQSPAYPWFNTFPIQQNRYSYGISQDLDYQGPGVRWRETSEYASRYPVDMSWRMAALYCNWICNGQQNDPATLLYGAYDTTTWGVGADGYPTDQHAHSPGAQYWIPTYDEMLAAMYHDPNRYGPGQAGWWLYPTSSDTPSIPGLPGVGTAMIAPAGHNIPYSDFPLGSYAAQSPWGLLDGSGSMSELVEDGSVIGTCVVDNHNLFRDRIDSGESGLVSWESDFFTLRIATTVPDLGTLASLSMMLGMCHRRRR